MKIVDTHQHLLDKGRFSYSWCKDIQELNQSFLIEDYIKAIEGAGIAKSIFMETYVDEPHALDEARYIQALANKHPLIAGIVASGCPEKQGFQEHLEQLFQLPKLRGIRRIFHFLPDEPFQTELFVENIRLLSRYGLTCDIAGFERQLPISIRLVRECPNVFFILNHCGEPDIKERGLAPWKAYIKQIAEFPNIACKISSVLDYSKDDLRLIIDHVIACFGWDRLVWGSDWPVCTLNATLSQWVDMSLELFKGNSKSELQKLFATNAERIYRV